MITQGRVLRKKEGGGRDAKGDTLPHETHSRRPKSRLKKRQSINGENKKKEGIETRRLEGRTLVETEREGSCVCRKKWHNG